MIQAARLRETFLRLIAIDGPSLAEHAVADFLAGELRSLGFEVELDAVPVPGGGSTVNLRAFLGAAGEPLLLSAHMDTVEPTAATEPVIEGSVVRSAGGSILGADDRAGIAVILEVARSVVEARSLARGFEILLTSCEERGLVGARSLRRELIRSRDALVLDGEGPVGTVILSAPFHAKFVASFEGRAAHAGIAIDEGRSAVHAMGMAIAGIGFGRRDGATVNVGVASGGSAMNIVAPEAECLGEVRAHDRAALERELARIAAVCEEVERETGVRVRVESELLYEGYAYERDDPFVAAIAGWFGAVGVEPVFTSTFGGSDTNILVGAGIRAVTLGIGCGNPHAPDEWADLDQMALLAEAIEVAMTEPTVAGDGS